MARWYVLIGPYEAKPATLETQLALREDGYEGVRVAKLRDRTGPSVAERLAALEDRLRTVETDEIVTKRLAALESALGEPVCVGCGGTVGGSATCCIGSGSLCTRCPWTECAG